MGAEVLWSGSWRGSCAGTRNGEPEPRT
jgi:hypothetical protein